jgi:hypothetical protein
MVLSTAKLLHNASPKPKEQQHQANATQRNQGGRCNGKQKQGGRGDSGHNGGRAVVIITDRMVAPGPLSIIPHILVPK